MKTIRHWFDSLYRVWRREFSLVLRDEGVLIFFLLLPTVYPLVYTLIYNPEVVHDLPVVIVDDCRTQRSRQLAEMADATSAIKIVGYAADIEEARRCMNEKGCYGIMLIPTNYDLNINREKQSKVQFYCDMSLLIRYRAFLAALTDLSLASDTEIQQQIIDTDSSPVANQAVILGNPSEGFASFVIPGLLILIIQQSLVLGITMLGGGAYERRRANNGIDPMEVNAPAAITVLGKSLCYFTIYIPLIVYMLHFVPIIFDLPRVGSISQWGPMVVPFTFAAIFMGMTLQPLVRQRETSMIVVVFTSLLFLFLSGITWPRYAMGHFWIALGDIIPSTWAVNAFTRINSDGATLQQNMWPLIALWILCAIYLTTAIILHKNILGVRKKSLNLRD